MRDLLGYLRGYGRECVLAPLFKFLEAAFQLATPLVVAKIVDRGVADGDGGLVVGCGLGLLALAVVGLACALCAQYFSARLAAGFGTRLRDDLFAHVLSLPQEQLDGFGDATLVTRLTNDTLLIQNGVNMFFRLILRSPFVVLGCTAMAYVIDGTQGAVFTVSVGALFAIVVALVRIPVRGYVAVQGLLDRVQSRTQENLAGVRTIRAFRREAAEEGAFDADAGELRSRQVSVGRVTALMNPLTYVGINLCLVAVIATGAVQVDAGALTLGAVVALTNYVAQILVELIKFVDFVVLISRSLAAARRVSAVLAVRGSMGEGELDACACEPSLAMRGVSFTYPGAAAPALEYVDFSVPAGGVLGVVGGTGSGKSTLAALVTRTYDAGEGVVELGGRDVRAYGLASLRRAVGVVEQWAPLFTGTIGENLRWGDPDADDGELLAAVRTAQADDVLASRPEGLDAEVGEGGRNFSGGQRQRLTIARTLARRPRVLVLDDSTSALDYATEARLRAALARDLPGTTKVVVSQRVSAVRHADAIVVLEDGRQVGCGTHGELLETCPVYRQICLSQLSAEDVGA